MVRRPKGNYEAYIGTNNFSIRLSNPAGASETNPAMCKVFCKP